MPWRGTLPPTTSGGQSARAPISRKGATTRSIGRLDSEASPMSSDGKSWAASTPASRRIVVPELPQSSGPSAARRPFRPEPCTSEASACTPRARRHTAVDFTSAPGERPRRCEVPPASAPRMSARWEIDLSPGRLTSPSSLAALRTVAITTALSPSPSALESSALPRRSRSVAGRPPPGGAAAEPSRR